ncbi:hypothetical protein BKA82DRAFT_11404 [Pisolithus tinctorius]|uniref:Uncharacterized protein n=1 Tax=Pisolithus tinctorius Marx 270 TaxID=870435 RepID=A0A0C3J761_PISTI|nr:hypothetical protein BKA82DRAFT_11404 [Pisolithus tinctorius]KIN93541.1 hypothetical protein M404DRAFT_11404 [Pisolithus tinctorius Marx 270]
MDAEDVVEDALKAVDHLSQAAFSRSGLKLRIPARTALPPKPSQMVSLEAELMDSVRALKSCNRIFGTLLTIDELLDPVGERSWADFDSGSSDAKDGSIKGIADEVQCEIAIAKGDIIEIEDKDADVDDVSAGPSLLHADLLKLCRQLEAKCMQYGDPVFSFELSSSLAKYCASLQRDELLNNKQTTLDHFIV